ncbi:MAG: helix-turn-helix domain-containing protein, partial [Ruminococcus sp.]|nr:helix-turn-helix domain-containing protein [Ruminococcus sp.]
DLPLADIAKAAGYSPYHFQRVFKEAVHMSPADYIRKRRISEIVRKIDECIRPISEIAFEYGFNSKENFTRAFMAEHHILPTEYKAASNSLKLYDRVVFTPSDYSLEPEITELETFTLVGYHSDEKHAPNFWNKYNAKNWSVKLSGGIVCEDYGVSSWNIEENRVEYFIGIDKENANGDTSGASELIIPGGLYAVFQTPVTTHFDFVYTIHRTWEYIKNEWLPGSLYTHTGGYDFESYVEKSRVFSEKIHIPIKLKEQ